MTGLRARLARWSQDPWVNHIAAPERAPRIDEAARFVGEHLGELDPVAPAQRDLETDLREIRARWAATRRLDSLDRRLARAVPWVLFLGPAEDRLANDEAFRRQYAAWLLDQPRGAVLSALVRTLLTHYSSSPSCAAWFAVAREAASRQESSAARAWFEVDRAYKILGVDGPEHLARSILAAFREGRQALVVLQECRLDAEYLDSPFLEEVVRRLLQVVERERIGLRPLEAMLAFLKGNGGLLRYQGLRGETARALLGPHLQTDPEVPVQRALQSFFLQTLGDPRIQPQRWAAIETQLRGVLIRWLTRQSFEVFLAVFDQTVDKDQWKRRKTFWSRYIKSGEIRDAWVVLGPDGQHAARYHLDAERSSYGALTGADAKQSVLLMTIEGPRGSVRIAEWSHNGKCRGWLDGDRSAPPFYGRSYEASQLRGSPPLQQPHLGAWEQKVELWIRSNTGARGRR